MDRTREKYAAAAVATQNRTTKTKPKQRASQSERRVSGRGKRARVESDDERDDEDEGEQDPPKRAKVLANDEKPAFLQPALVTGATLKDYQLEGVAWMVSLWENGISGILGELSPRRRSFIVGGFC
jgi:ATP-dependent DNA helicase